MEKHCVVTRTRTLLFLPVAFVGIFFVLPVATTIIRFLSPSNIANTITDTAFISVAWFSLWQAVLSTVATLMIGIPATWAVSRYTFRGVRLVRGILTAPFVLPAVVVAAGVLAVTNSRGVAPIIWAHVIFNVSVIVRVVGPRWSMIDHRLENAAATLGAAPLSIFRRVVWPEISHATLNASLLVFIYCFTSFGVIAILGGVSRRTMESEIFTQAVRLGDATTATSLAIIQAIIIASAALAAHRLSRDSPAALTTRLPQPLSSRPRHRHVVLLVVGAAVAVVATPLLATLYRSVSLNGRLNFSAWENVLAGTLPSLNVTTQSLVATSLTFAITAALICIPLAVIISSLAPRSQILNIMTSLPFAISAATLGIGLIITFDTHPFAWRSERWLLPVVHAVIALPLVLRTMKPAFVAVPERLRGAARTLGASPLRTWWYIDVAMTRPAIMRATGLTMAISLGEFGATSFLSRSGSTTLPIAIAQLLGRPGIAPQHAGFALSALMIIVTIGVMSRA